MRQDNRAEQFDTSAALAVLDGIIHQPTACLTPSAGRAWESAWIACLTNSSDWADRARRDFGAVLRELEAVVNTPRTLWRHPGRTGRRGAITAPYVIGQGRAKDASAWMSLDRHAD